MSVCTGLLLSVAMGLCGCSIIDGLGYALGVKDKCEKIGNAQPPVPVGELADRWSLRFGPLPKDREPWTWNVLPVDDMRRICGGVPPDIYGCTDYNGGCPYTVVTQANAHDCRLAAHEYAHTALFWLHGAGHTDSAHSTPAIWQSGGFVDSFAVCQ